MSSGAEIDRIAVVGAKAPGWMWSLWASNGWRERWRHDTVRHGMLAAQDACGRLPTRRKLREWRACWAKADKGRVMTAGEWSRRTGEPIPDWLQD